MKALISLLSLVLLLVTVPAYAERDLALLFAEAEKVKLSNSTEFRKLLDQISQLTLTNNQQQNYLILLGYNAQVTGDHDQAIKLYKQALDTGNSIDLKFRTLVMLSNIMTVKQNITDSFTYLFQATELVDKVSDPELKPSVKIQAMNSYMSLNLFAETKAISQEILDDGIEGLSRCNALYYNNYSTLKLDPGQVQLSQLEAGIEYCKAQGIAIMELFGQSLVVRYYLLHKEYSKAEQLLNEHMAAVEKSGFVHLLGYYYAFLGQAQYALNKISTASVTVDKLLNMNSISFSSEPMVAGLKLKAEIEESIGNTSSALTFYKKYIESDKIYKDTLSLQQTSYHLAKSEISNKNQQIALLEKNNTLLTLENELAAAENNNKKLFIALLIATLVFLSYVAFRAFRNSGIYRKIAENDSLVGISNRYFFTKSVSALLAHSKTTRQIDAFIIFDLDWFKQVNDQHGHLTGDWVLKAIVDHCRQFVRNVDIFGRIGGEEFAMFLPACTAEKAALLAEILRDVIEQIDCSGSGHLIKMTASFGVTCTDRSGYELRHLFRDADIALYLSKNQGRNKVTLFEPTQLEKGPAAGL